MKNLLLTIITLISYSTFAQTGVQRSAGSSYSDYIRYLYDSKNISFVRAYLELSKNINVETISVNRCLDSLFTGQANDDSCYDALRELNSQPLNASSREIVLSFLKKLRKYPSKYQKTYIQFEKGFSLTHPHLASRLGTLSTSVSAGSKISLLEVKAWKRIMQKKLMLSESVLLINGEAIKDLSSWVPPQGVFQWALISNTHEPIIKVSSFSQFAAESAQETRPFSNQTCEVAEKKEIKTFGLKSTQLFFSRKCILTKNMQTELASSEHLGDIPTNIKISSPSSKIHWIFPVLTVVGIGLASQLKDKSVSISF